MHSDYTELTQTLADLEAAIRQAAIEAQSQPDNTEIADLQEIGGVQ